MKFQSSSSAATKDLGVKLAKIILGKGPQKKGATVVSLKGDLGAGKTTFTQGFFKGLGLKKIPASPTFILMRRTGLRGQAFKNVYHIDAYRVRGHEDFEALGIKDMLAEPTNIFLIEWPDKIAKLLPGGRIKIEFEHGKDAEKRIIKLPKEVLS